MYDECKTPDPSVPVVLPCNVVVRAVDEATHLSSRPGRDDGLSDDGGLGLVAADARQRLTAMLAALKEES